MPINKFKEMNNHRFILASNKVPKLDCPYCGAKKHWQRYIDTETGEVLPEQHGCCDNTAKCGQWVTPKQTGYAKMIWAKENEVNRVNKVNVSKQKYFHTQLKTYPIPEPVFIPFEILKPTLQPERYAQNTFIQNLLIRVTFPFEIKDVEKVISHYYLGTVTNGYRAGAITFPFIDIQGNIRAVQVKQFDQTNHTTGTDFLHSIIEKHHSRKNKPLPEWLTAYIKQDKLVSCLFGEHLLDKFPSNPIALVEAPKTSIYGTLYFGFPDNIKDFIWLAVYNKSSFSFDKLKVLKGRNVFVFPDLSLNGDTFKEWQDKAKEYEHRLPGTRFIFSDLLELNAPVNLRKKGSDLADILIEMDWRKFRKQVIQETTNQPKIELLPDFSVKVESLDDVSNSTSETNTHLQVSGKISNSEIQKSDWSKEISELESYFSNYNFPNQPIKLNYFTTIENIPLFIESNLSIIKAHNGNTGYISYLNLLIELKNKLSIPDSSELLK